jgi:dihydroorotate dehydrogenase (NAD+) catalytic subunit
MVEVISSKFDLSFVPPIMNAAGFLGFTPDSQTFHDLRVLGAFVTNPVSLKARSPAAGTRFIPFSGGFLLHTGHPNPGLKTALHRYAARWRRSQLPVWVHLLVQTPYEATAMVRKLEVEEGVAGIELGLPPGIDTISAQALIQAARGELPLIVVVPVEQAAEIAAVAASAGADAVCLGARRSVLPDSEGKLVKGRLYGPSLFPQTLQTVTSMVSCGIPVIAGGGLYAPWQGQALLSCGAAAFQLDGVLWKGGWQAVSGS